MGRLPPGLRVLLPGDLRAGDRPGRPRFGGLDPDLVRAMATGFAGRVRAAVGPTRRGSTRSVTLSASARFRADAEGLQEGPGRLPRLDRGRLAVIRVLITGTRQSPDLASICAALGRDEVLRRVSSFAKELADAAPRLRPQLHDVRVLLVPNSGTNNTHTACMPVSHPTRYPAGHQRPRRPGKPPANCQTQPSLRSITSALPPAYQAVLGQGTME